MELTRCDRCGKEESNPKKVSQYGYFDGYWEGNKTIQLCNKCGKEFKGIVRKFMA